MRPFCVKCCREMRPVKNDRAVEIREQIFFGDEYTCDRCGAQIVTGFGKGYSVFDPRDMYFARRDIEDRRGNLLVEAANG